MQSAFLIAASEGYLELLRMTLRTEPTSDCLGQLRRHGAHPRGRARPRRRGRPTAPRRVRLDHVNSLGWTALHEAVMLGDGSERYVDTVEPTRRGGRHRSRRGATASPRARCTPARSAVHRHRRSARGRASHPLGGADAAALLAAAAAGDADRDAVALALRGGADRGPRRATPYGAAARVTDDHVDVARLLVALGADPDAAGRPHDTPWLVTGVTGSVAMLEALLPADPDLTIRNRYGGVSVIPASERGHVDYVRRVVQTDIDVNHVNDLGWTALLEAVILGDGSEPYQQIVRILLEAGADPRYQSQTTRLTALEHARARMTWRGSFSRWSSARA